MEKTIVILHGWGKSGRDYQQVQRILEKKGYTVFAPDMPGFGKEVLKETMVLDDYVRFVKNYLKKSHIRRAIFIGHSFGGRVAAKLAAYNPQLVDKLILTGAPLIKQPLSFKNKVISTVAKPVKKLSEKMPRSLQQLLTKSVYKLLGEWDYYKAGNLKETFKKIIAEDLGTVIPHIRIPTYIIWGESDTFVPLSVGKNIARIIPGAKFSSIPFATHKLPYENPKIFTEKVISFLA